MTLRVGLFGCGRIAGFFHAPILARLPGIRVTAIADPDAACRMRIAAILPGATTYADWRRPLELGEIDAAVICLPPALHAPAAIAAMRAGAHAYVEKPLALTVAEADAMLAAQDASARTGMVGLNFRFHPQALALRDALAAGTYGELMGVRTIFTSARRVLPGWKGDPRMGGGAVEDLGTHHLDLVPFLTGRDIDKGSLSARSMATGNGTFAMMSATLADGVPVAITVGQTTGLGTHRIELLCEAGHVMLDLAHGGPPRIAGPGDGVRARLAAALERRKPDPSFALALEAFVAAAARGQPASPDFADGRRVLALVERAQAPRQKRAA